MFVSWLVLVAAVYIMTDDLWKALGAVSAYVLYRIIGNMHDYELQKQYQSMLNEETDAEPNEAQGK